MPSARIRRLQEHARTHPLVFAHNALTELHYLSFDGGITVALSLNK